MLQKRSLAVLGAILLVLAACGPAATPTTAPARATPTSAPAPTATLSPVATSVVTPTPKPSLTPTPAATQPPGPKMGGVLRWVGDSGADPTGPDPHRFTRLDLYDYINYVHTRLFRFSSAEKGCSYFPLEPELATKWEWVNDKTLDLTLRQGVKFPPRPPVNGREFTAEDVVYAATNQWPKTSQIAASLKTLVDSVQALEKYKVRFNFRIPAPDFLPGILPYAAALITPKEVFGPKGDIERLEDNVGLGPYMLKQYVPGVKFEFEKNPNYFREGVPRLDGMVARIMPDRTTQLSSLRTGQLDFMYFKGGAPLVQEAQRTAPYLKVLTCPQAGQISLNMRTDKPPFNDVRVRRAIAMAVDRDVLIKTVFMGMAVPVWTTLTSGFTQHYMDRGDFPAEVRQYLEYNPERARQLLAEAGYPKGFTTSIRSSQAYPDQARMAEVIVDMLAKVGIKASLDMVERGLFTETVYTSKYPEMSVSFTTGGESLDIAMWTALHTGGGNNRSAISDPEMDRLLDEWRVTMDAKRSAELVRAIQIRQVDQSWMVLLLVGQQVLIAQPYVHVPVYKTINKNDSDSLMYMWRD